MKLNSFWLWAAIIAALGVAFTVFDIIEVNEFIYFAGYVVLQYVILATAWNILGGYTGYVNFGSAGFFRRRRLHLGRHVQVRRSAAAAADPRRRDRLRADRARHGLSHACA